MSAAAAALALGAVVGLGVAMPLGAIGVLLLQTGMTQGWRPSAAGGLGVALVDLAYAGAAVLAGTTLSRLLVGHEGSVRLVGAAVLGVVAAGGLTRTVRDRATAAGGSGVAGSGVAGSGVGGSGVGGSGGAGLVVVPGPVAGPGRMLVGFFALTAVNPLTVIYFTAVVAGLADRLATTPARVAFVLGVGVASAAWQLSLAGAGALLGARVSTRVRTGLAVVGYAVVAGLAVALALR